MWTPKRLLLLVGGFVLFFAAYQVYVLFLGQFDGLPPLPAEYAAAAEPGAPPPDEPAPQVNNAVRRLMEAFGAACEEKDRPIKLEWRLQGVVMAAERWEFLADGKLRLIKVSVAIFGKSKGDGKGEEINTVKGDVADIEFDKPIHDLRDATSNNRRPVGGKLTGNVVLVNNRRTRGPEDDLRLYTAWMQYSDADHRVWTDAEVLMKEGDPEQRWVRAQGMEVILQAGEPKDAPARKKQPQSSINGVKSVRLDRNVKMWMLMDGRSNFLGSSRAEPPPANAPAAPRTPVVIESLGVFTYEPGPDGDKAVFNDRVHVQRDVVVPTAAAGKTPAGKVVRYDQLDCDRLEMLFTHKKPDDKAKRPPTDDPAGDLELSLALATGRRVELVSDVQNLQATCTSLRYDKAANTTTLQDDTALVAEHDNYVLRMKGTLMLRHPAADSKDREIQETHAKGPGEIRVKAKQPGLPERWARWERELHTAKDGACDRVTLQGRALFEDPDRGKLQGDQLVVWLENLPPEAAPPPAAGQPPASPEERRRPRKLEAMGAVALTAKDLQIPRAERLRVRFEDVKLPPPTPGTPAAPGLPGLPGAPAPAAPGAPAPGADPAKLPAPEAQAKPPLVLTARGIEVELARDGNRTELQRLQAEDGVHVTQAPTGPDNKGVEIKGDQLTLIGSPAGNKLEVTGTEVKKAYVQMDKLAILGPFVTIDQPTNQAWVNGGGSMKLPSKTDFQGNALQEPVDVIVYWNERMFFDGKFAEYGGGVQAVQGQARLTCKVLQVTLDRYVSLKEPQRGQGSAQPALDKMLCDTDVHLTNGIPAGPGPVPRWKQYQRIYGREASFDNPESKLGVTGIGTVWLLQAGNQLPAPGQPAAPVKPAAGTAGGETMKLTRVTFEGSMVGFKANNKVIFTGGVDLIHLPADDPDVAIDPGRLPPGGMRVNCERLEAAQIPVPGQKDVTQQAFDATGRVWVGGDGQTFWGQCDHLTYEESKDLLILEGQGGNFAKLARQVRRGAKPETVEAKKIKFWRNENRIEFENARNIGVAPPPGKPQ